VTGPSSRTDTIELRGFKDDSQKSNTSSSPTKQSFKFRGDEEEVQSSRSDDKRMNRTVEDRTDSMNIKLRADHPQLDDAGLRKFLF